MREKILATLAGLGLFLAGWFYVEKKPVRTEPEEALAVLRPIVGNLSIDGEKEGLPISDGARGYVGVPKESNLSFHRNYWGEANGQLEPSDLLITLRCTPPLSKFDPVTENKKPVKLTNLATDKELEREGKFYRLEAGPYELLAEAEGHIPDKLSVELKPGELRKMEVALKALPTFSLPARPTRPTAPPIYRPPVARPRPRPRPRPRFTPIAKPQPPPVQPVPMFTPLP